MVEIAPRHQPVFAQDLARSSTGIAAVRKFSTPVKQAQQRRRFAVRVGFLGWKGKDTRGFTNVQRTPGVSLSIPYKFGGTSCCWIVMVAHTVVTANLARSHQMPAVQSQPFVSLCRSHHEREARCVVRVWLVKVPDFLNTCETDRHWRSATTGSRPVSINRWVCAPYLQLSPL